MKDDNASGFKFNIEEDDERSDPLFQTKKREETWKENRRVETLSQRMTMLSLLMLCLIGVILLAAYLHVEQKFERAGSTGSVEVQSFYQGTGEKLSALSSQYEEFEAALMKKVTSMEEAFSTLERTTASLTQRLNRLEKNLNNVRASETGKGKLIGAVTQLENRVTSIHAELKTLKDASANLDRLENELDAMKGARAENMSADEKFTQEMTTLAGTVDEAKKEVDALRAEMSALSTDGSVNAINRLKTDIAVLSSDKASKASLDLALEDLEKRFKENLILINENLGYKQNKIRALQEKLKKIEERVNTVKKTP